MMKHNWIPQLVKCPQSMETVHQFHLLYLWWLLTKGQAMIHRYSLTPPHSHNEWVFLWALSLFLPLNTHTHEQIQMHARTRLGFPSCLPPHRSHVSVLARWATPESSKKPSQNQQCQQNATQSVHAFRTVTAAENIKSCIILTQEMHNWDMNVFLFCF